MPQKVINLLEVLEENKIIVDYKVSYEYYDKVNITITHNINDEYMFIKMLIDISLPLHYVYNSIIHQMKNNYQRYIDDKFNIEDIMKIPKLSILGEYKNE